jgi:hypothetical protein
MMFPIKGKDTSKPESVPAVEDAVGEPDEDEDEELPTSAKNNRTIDEQSVGSDSDDAEEPGAPKKKINRKASAIMIDSDSD